MKYKTYKTVDEQIEYLKENKKIVACERDEFFLYERNYISVINPYKEFFAVGKSKDENHIYNEETDFVKIMKLIKVDDAFSCKLYSYISVFERKFKNVLITEMCGKYMADPIDKECIRYISEIQKFLNDDCDKNLPLFCPSLPNQLTKKGVAEDTYGRESKSDLLRHILEIRCAESATGKCAKKSNKLIKHYLERQQIVPLWVIPNALTLGELKMLYSMLDVNSQKRIMAKFSVEKNWKRLNGKDILSFSGILEIIRNIRNVVNHFEPLFPHVREQLKSYKKVWESQFSKALKTLEWNYNDSLLIDLNFIDLKETKLNPYTKRNVDILTIMKEYIK